MYMYTFYLYIDCVRNQGSHIWGGKLFTSVQYVHQNKPRNRNILFKIFFSQYSSYKKIIQINKNNRWKSCSGQIGPNGFWQIH